MHKFHVGDLIQVTAGKDQGKQGKITRAIPQQHQVVVEGVNIYKKHRRAQARQPSGIIDITKPLPTANIALVCPHCQQPTRVAFQVNQNQKGRICAKCHQPIAKPESSPPKPAKPKK